MNETEMKYNECLEEFTKSILNSCDNNIYSIILFGGIVRDGRPIVNWSDIDLLVIFETYKQSYINLLSKIIYKLENTYFIRIDISILFKHEIGVDVLLKNIYKSELLNVLTFRENVSKVIYGTQPELIISKEQEKQAALFYLNQIQFALRNYLIDNIYKPKNPDYSMVIPRLIRWTFSVIRSSLRLFDIYSHPYNDSIIELKKLFPDYDINLLHKLIKIRNGDNNFQCSLAIDIADFIEMFIPKIISAYYEKTVEPIN